MIAKSRLVAADSFGDGWCGLLAGAESTRYFKHPDEFEVKGNTKWDAKIIPKVYKYD